MLHVACRSLRITSAAPTHLMSSCVHHMSVLLFVRCKCCIHVASFTLLGASFALPTARCIFHVACCPWGGVAAAAPAHRDAFAHSRQLFQTGGPPAPHPPACRSGSRTPRPSPKSSFLRSGENARTRMHPALRGTHARGRSFRLGFPPPRMQCACAHASVWCGRARSELSCVWPRLRAVLSCAGAYVSGPLNSNNCPAGSVRITTEAACRTAAAAAGKTFTAVETDSSYPRGCYSLFSEAFFNRHTVGAGFSQAQLLCAAVTTGAPPGADARGCMRTGVRGGTGRA
jgi:hypothetical protein